MKGYGNHGMLPHETIRPYPTGWSVLHHFLKEFRIPQTIDKKGKTIYKVVYRPETKVIANGLQTRPQAIVALQRWKQGKFPVLSRFP